MVYSPLPQFLLSMLNPLRYLNVRQLFTVCETSCSTRGAYSLIQCLSKDHLSTLGLKYSTILPTTMKIIKVYFDNLLQATIYVWPDVPRV